MGCTSRPSVDAQRETSKSKTHPLVDLLLARSRGGISEPVALGLAWREPRSLPPRETTYPHCERLEPALPQSALLRSEDPLLVATAYWAAEPCSSVHYPRTGPY